MSFKLWSEVLTANRRVNMGHAFLIGTGRCLLACCCLGDGGYAALEFQIAAEDFVPGQALLVEFLHEGIGIELFDIPYARAFPQAEHEHARSDTCGYTGGIADALHAGFFVGGTV